MSNDLRLFYHNPATTWDEVLPLGNGHLGAMVWGDTGTEKIGLNEGTLWSGYPRDKVNPNALPALPKVRKLIFEGEYRKAQDMLEKEMLGEFTESFMPLGNLLITTDSDGPVTDYTRQLNLQDAVASVIYLQGECRHRRSYFVSNPHRALVLRLDCDSAALDVTFKLESQLKHRIEARDAALLLMGQCPDHVDPDYTGTEDPYVWGDKGIRFEAALQVLETDGTVTAKDRALTISNASFAVLSFTAVHNPDLSCEYARSGYEGLLQAHLADYRALFSRVTLDLGKQPDIATDERLIKLKQGGEDPALYALYFQFGRYLMISASRPGGMPMNLQGIWNWMMQPPWSSNYTTNINTQMNYWPALTCGLPECMEPYNRFVEMLCANGQKTADAYYGCRGFTLGHNTDGWASTNPVGVIHGQTQAVDDAARYASFALASVWMCEWMWRHYEYTADQAFLTQTAFPVLREAVLFCVDFLVEHEGYEVICPSTSPENAFYTDKGEITSVSYAATMDMTLVREAFDMFERACAALKIDDELLEVIEEKKSKLFPLQIGRHGQLQEWCKDFEEPEPGHRHLSHLYGLFPAELFHGDETLIQACRKSIDLRLAHGGGHTGWSCAWLINLFAVLKDGEAAYDQLHTLLTRSTYPNLWDGHPPFQIDGNFGGIAGIANMLVLDRGGEIEFLPALPKAFANGSVTGLRIKGNKAVDIRWEDGELVEKRIYECS